MFQKLDGLSQEYSDIEQKLADPEIVKDVNLLKSLSKRRSEIEMVVKTYSQYKETQTSLEETRNILSDPQERDAELRELAELEIDELENKLSTLRKELQTLLLPKDPRDGKNIILELRAGTGGEEAALFCADLLRMYAKYSEGRRWKLEIMSQNVTGVGGFKEVIVSISGNNVFSKLKYEGGVHRVQRVPQTEAQGRIHTSAVTVAVLPEAEDVDISIDENKDIRIDVFRSSGPGGQSVNTTDSAVRITHLPTGIVISCQDEKSQHKNKSKAMKILKARLFDMAIAEQQEKISQERRKMVSSGDRSSKIRTYNFPQGRVTDHRIGLTLYKLDRFLDGELDEMIDALTAHFEAEALKANALG